MRNRTGGRENEKNKTMFTFPLPSLLGGCIHFDSQWIYSRNVARNSLPPQLRRDVPDLTYFFFLELCCLKILRTASVV
jgi:hypothetical protein